MKLSCSCDCSCHGAAAQRQVAPSTGFFVLTLSLFLVMCGLVQSGVIPLRFW